MRWYLLFNSVGDFLYFFLVWIRLRCRFCIVVCKRCLFSLFLVAGVCCIACWFDLLVVLLW